MKIKAITNFAHAPSRRAFQIGKLYEVTDAAAKEFTDAKLAEYAEKPEESKAPAPKKNKGE